MISISVMIASTGCKMKKGLISFAGPFTVSEAHSLGMSSGTSDVCPALPHSLRSDLTHF